MFTADAAPSTECAVAPLAREAIRLIHQRRLYDGRSDELMAIVDKRIDEVEIAASYARAHSPLGLFFQVCIGAEALDTARSDASGYDCGVAAMVGLAAVHFTAEAVPLARFYMTDKFSFAAG